MKVTLTVSGTGLVALPAKMREAAGIHKIENVAFAFPTPNARPLVVLENAREVTLDHLTTTNSPDTATGVLLLASPRHHPP